MKGSRNEEPVSRGFARSFLLDTQGVVPWHCTGISKASFIEPLLNKKLKLKDTK